MMRRAMIVVLVGLSLWSSWSGAQPQRVKLLLVDETKTLQASLLVQVFASVLRDTGLFTLEARLADVQSTFDDPLGLNQTGKKYEIILIIPSGIEEGSLRQLWIVSGPIYPETSTGIFKGIQMIKTIVQQGSGGQLEPVGVMDDMLPGLLATIFARNGWLE